MEFESVAPHFVRTLAALRQLTEYFIHYHIALWYQHHRFASAPLCRPSSVLTTSTSPPVYEPNRSGKTTALDRRRHYSPGRSRSADRCSVELDRPNIMDPDWNRAWFEATGSLGLGDCGLVKEVEAVLRLAPSGQVNEGTVLVNIGHFVVVKGRSGDVVLDVFHG
ncbi:hypothetical protein BU23DRAFT_595247 [Bimuria novae-zelandiae CBS 107.79]|uniref:Uncharacterized protein n=1 Tax=Bimuria novae-zelandiae CBS 107.79 TaxID=1447943 RepID=A0A6A5VRC7_9PLEO|nr:hypothetical protein BU23DRAFT_595247 [Bimuria novae-zelandiae CBS 107.79]